MMHMPKEGKAPTPLSEFGEFGLIHHLTKGIKLKNRTSFKGIGDDAALLGEGESLTVVSTDMLMEGIHFNLTYTPLKYLGYKAVAVNVSDICAMNAVAEQVTVSLAVSAKFSVEALELLYQGINEACEEFKVDLIGGDTSSSLTGMAISLTVIGRGEKNSITYRSGAKEKDVICVSGDLGAAYMGLLLLERERKVSLDVGEEHFVPQFGQSKYLLERQLRPKARCDIVRFLTEQQIVPTSMIDLSDGLSSELHHLCEQSEIGCLIYEDKLPLNDETKAMAKEFQVSSITAAMNGGEEYELLFTLPPLQYDKLKYSPDITPIGYAVHQEEGLHFISTLGEKISLKAQGWNCYKKK